MLRLEYRTGPGSDSGILLRSGAAGDPAASGMKLRILSDAGKPASTQSTGSLGDIVAPTQSVSKPDGEWNQVEVSLIKRELTAIWNGQKIFDVNLDDPKYKALAQRQPYGYIGLEGHAAGAPVEFRNIRVKILKIGPLLNPEK